MSFAAPLVLLGLLAVAALLVSALIVARRRRATLDAFVTRPLTASPLPRRAGARVLATPVLLCLALALLIVAAARPRYHATVVVTGATVMLVNDVSDSMQATDVSPDRLGAAKRAALRFLAAIPDTVQTGSIEFARHVTVLQSPTLDRRATEQAVAQLAIGGGGTAIGDAIQSALTQIADAPKIAGHRPPGAIVLLSDGTANVGTPPVAAAQAARRAHVEIDTVAIGTGHGQIVGREHGRAVTLPVPVSPGELAQIAQASGGRAFRAPDAVSARAIYDGLAQRLGHQRVERSLLVPFAAAGAVLALIAGGLSLLWFGRLT